MSEYRKEKVDQMNKSNEVKMKTKRDEELVKRQREFIKNMKRDKQDKFSTIISNQDDQNIKQLIDKEQENQQGINLDFNLYTFSVNWFLKRNQFF